MMFLEHTTLERLGLRRSRVRRSKKEPTEVPRDHVASGGVSVVLAQERDRFTGEPAYHYLLRPEFEEHGTKIRA
jgi:hypothetical protein